MYNQVRKCVSHLQRATTRRRTASPHRSSPSPRADILQEIPQEHQRWICSPLPVPRWICRHWSSGVACRSGNQTRRYSAVNHARNRWARGQVTEMMWETEITPLSSLPCPEITRERNAIYRSSV